MNKDLLFEFKPKFSSYVRLFSSKNIGLAMILACFSMLIVGILEDIIPEQMIIVSVFILDIILFIIFLGLLLFLDKKNFEVTSYKVYQERIEFEEGFINHKYTVIKMENVREIHFEQNFIQRLANLGTIRFITAANDTASLTGVAFIDIENPRDVYTKVKNIYEKM